MTPRIRMRRALAAAVCLAAAAAAAPAQEAVREAAREAAQEAGTERLALLSAPRWSAEAAAARARGDAAAAEAAEARLRAVAALPPAEAAPVVEGRAPVSAANLLWDAQARRLRARLDFPEEPSRRRLLKAKDDESRAGRRLTRLVASGRGAGLHGDLYDNRDRDHSRLRLRDRPRLSATEYAPEARAAGLDSDLNEALLFDAIVIGNASKALTGGPLWRSLPRLALTTRRGAARLFQNFAANHLYVFPEHRDHDPERGDLYPAATPYVWISQGSSGSDQPMLGALADALAALRPETKARLREEGLVAAAAQMLVRRAFLEEEGDAAYLDGAAHPTVFDGAPDRERLIALANDLAADAVPPMPTISVLSEPQPAPGLQIFGEGLDERLFDTPHAVARLARSAAGARRYVLGVDAADPNGRPLTFRWVVLRGDPERVRVTPLDEQGGTAEVTVDWSEPRPVPGRPELTSPRVDIGLFAHNGVEWSAPAFFSLYFPQDRAARFDEAGRPLEIDYGGGADGAYADPALFPARDWRDVYAYGPDGALLGWTRFRGEARSGFTRHGFRVLDRDSQGRPRLAERVAYPVERGAQGRLFVREAGCGERVGYAYDGPEDRLGYLVEPEAVDGNGGGSGAAPADEACAS